MKKNFLLLLLLTLLPLAGWATDYEVQVTTFNGTATWTGTKPAVQPGWFTAVPTSGTLSNEQKNFIASKLQVKDITENPNYDAGSWNYRLELSGGQVVTDDADNNYTIYVNSSTTATLTITKWETAPVFNLGELAYVTDVLAYDPTSEGQTLLSGGATATSNGKTVPVIYTLDPNAETVVKFNNFADVKATDAGDYTVYYKVAETDNYVGSAWTPIKEGEETLSKNIAKIDNAITTLTLAGWTYDPEKTAAPAVGEGDADIHIAATYGAADATFTYAKETNNTWGAFGDYATVVGGHAGKYKVKAAIAASTNYNEIEGDAEFTIDKATPVFTTLPTFAEGKVYDGSSLKLIKSAGEATLGAKPKYRIKAKKANGSWGSGSAWKFGFENDLFTKTDAGVYKIEYTTDPTDDLNAATSSPYFESDEITIAKADIKGFTDPVAKTGLRVKGDNEAQDLVTEASWGENTELGTFQYKVNDGDWSAVAKGTTAGTYSVNFQIVPTDAVNYNTYTIAEPLSVTIADKSTVTIATNANQTFGYGTTPVIENTVNWSADHANVDFSTNESKQLKWEWYAGTDAECLGSPVTADANGYYPVGSYYVKGYNAELTGDDADYWEIAYTPALVKITAGQVTAKISGTATYGSQPEFTLTHVSGLSPAEAENFNAGTNLTNVTIKQNGEVVNNLENVAPDNAGLAALAKGEYDLEATASCGTNYAVVVTGEKLTVGEKSIAGAVITVTTNPDAIVYNNKAWGTAAGNEIEFTVDETSGIEAADYDVTYSNNVNAGTATITLTGKRNYTGNVTKDFTIKKAGLTIKAVDFTGDKAWTYGTTEPTYAVTVEGQAEGETALEVGGTLAGIDGALTVVRTSNETVGMHTGALVAQFGSAQPVESDNYTITYSAGNLQVAKGAVVIKLKEAVTATYGDDPATSINAAIKDIANYEYVSGLSELEAANFASFIDVAAATFELTETKPQVGTDYTFAIAGATSTNYGVTINPGTYNVTAAPITLYAKDQDIDWSNEATNDDTPNTTVSEATVAIAAGGLKYTDELKDVVASIVIASQNVGTNNISLTAAENANYNIVVNSDGTNAKFGVLTVTGAPALALSTADPDLADKLASYNGKSMPVTIDFSKRNGRTLGATRNWEKENWVTMTLPFNISVAELSQKLGYAIVNVIDAERTVVSGTDSKFYGKVTMKGGNGSDDYLVANKPFLVKIADNIADRNNGVIDFGQQTIVAPASEEDLKVNAGQGAKFVGTYKTKSVSKDDNANVWFMLGNYAEWAYITSDAKWDIVPFEAYIDMTSMTGGAPRNMTFFFEEIDGSTTAITSIEAGNLNSKLGAEGWYTLNGVKLQNAPTQKGVYIKDGKKVVIK